ncbi:hypothetical protein V3481_006981 [Fusarium oxysporum f. sp. vasinfectum]
MDCDDDMRRDIEEELIKRSGQYVPLGRYGTGTARDQSQTWLQSFVPTLRSTQNELDGLYNSTFKRSEAPEELSRILSILAASQRPLTLDEIDVGARSPT